MSDFMLNEGARAWSFDELVREGLSLIPACAPGWTNHNASDPGITLVELLAYISEILVYRALRVTPDAKFNFLRLLGYHGKVPLEDLAGRPSQEIEEAIRARIDEMSHAETAVTPADFEALARRAMVRRLGEDVRFRVKCLPEVDVRRMMETRSLTAVEAPGDVSILVALDRTTGTAPDTGPLPDLQEELQRHCLLTTRAHVAAAVELHLSVACGISPQPDVTLADAVEAVDAALQHHFDPLQAGGSTVTQPFGRTLHLASVAGVMDATDGVDFVENVTVARIAVANIVRDDQAAVGIRIGEVARLGEDTRLGGDVSITMHRFQTDETGEAEAIALHPWEVLHVRLASDLVWRIPTEDAPGATEGPRRG
jgi:hypothetical protein